MMLPETVVCFRWTPLPGYRSKFGPQTVTVLRNMVRRHYTHPHRFVCITDRPEEIDADIDTIPLWPDYRDVLSPHGRHSPSCYRRLKLFAPEMGELLGSRFVWLDLDTVVVGDLTALWNRKEDFVIWADAGVSPKNFYNGSMCLMTAGARPQVWTDFNPKTSPMQAYRGGSWGSDQGWISFKLGRGEATWNKSHGVYSWRMHLEGKSDVLPKDARIVMFHGQTDPDSPKAQRVEWIRRNYQ